MLLDFYAGSAVGLVVTGKDMKRTLRENPRKAEIAYAILEIKRLSHGTWKRPMCAVWALDVERQTLVRT